MSTLSTRNFAIISIGLVFVACFALAGIKNGWFEFQPAVSENDSTELSDNGSPDRKAPSLADALGVGEEELKTIGGIKRPSRDLAFDAAKQPKGPPKSPYKNPGRAPALKGDENSQVAGLFKELNDPKGPLSARTAYAKPDDFDKEVYEQDPESYLNKIRPGRAFYPAQPGADVTQLQPQSRQLSKVLQGEKVVLQVKAEPGNPVTFYTPQVGEFDNRLTTYSVAANENGIAQATYTAGPGSRGLVDILAASPLNSGQVHFVVKVELPE